MSFFSIDAIFSSTTILHFASFITSLNTIRSHVVRWQYSVTSSSIRLVTSYKSSRLLIFLGKVPLLEFPLEEKEEEEKEVELISVYRDVTIGS